MGVALVIALVFAIGLITIPDIVADERLSVGAKTATTSTTVPPTTPTSTTTSTSQTPTSSSTSTTSTYQPTTQSTATSTGNQTINNNTETDGGITTNDNTPYNNTSVVNENAGINGSIASAKVDEASVAQQNGPSFCAGNLTCIENVLRALCIDCEQKGWPAGPDDPLAIFDVRVSFEPIDSNMNDIIIQWRTNKPSSSQVEFDISSAHVSSSQTGKTARITSLNTFHQSILNNQLVNRTYLLQLLSETKDEKANTEWLAAQSPKDYDSIWEMVLKTIKAYI